MIVPVSQRFVVTIRFSFITSILLFVYRLVVHFKGKVWFAVID